MQDHEDSVLCVRIEGGRLVTCSKDRTIRTYAFPSFVPQFVFRGHRAAVNTVSVVGDIIVSGSGDRSVRVWDANKGTLVKTFGDHHARGIASIEFRPPFLLSGSSDSHLRMFDIATSKGWSTCPKFDDPAPSDPPEDEASQWPQILGGPSNAQNQHQPGQYSLTTPCEACGHVPSVSSAAPAPGNRNEPRGSHSNLVRSVALGDQFAVSGSYDSTVKVWDRKMGALVADLTGGHTGRIFSIGSDCTKIVSCGGDQRICIWDFSHGIDTSFIKL
ncbi:hypothetical protein SERLADRAFT_476051 [Serpula lacrymans var. lacrymans S7.9]|nr:uncharacterized protein SERLADRAFT_476051 [Serpula lacrymans var. lacrymans S7.9]EGO21185.1 hypothetical protein SERLADRAFT_476051 [Serpula lacrymans var. lacrymans S7.9]